MSGAKAHTFPVCLRRDISYTGVHVDISGPDRFEETFKV